MQINNTSTNFGSIKLSKDLGNKSLSGLTKALETFKTIAPGGKDVLIIREKMNLGEAALITGQDGFSVVAKNFEDEDFIFRQIKKSFDPNAKFIEDVPPTKFEGDIIEIKHN